MPDVGRLDEVDLSLKLKRAEYEERLAAAPVARQILASAFQKG